MSKVIVVTGAGGVLCSGFAEFLAKKGHKVALLDLNEQAAQAVAEGLKIAGISIEIEAVPRAEYQARLAEGKFDLYLGEIRLTADHSLRPLLRGGDASFGISQKGKAAASYRAYLGGTATLAEFLTVFGEEMPYLPLCWRSGLAAYHRGITTVTPSAYDPYGGLAEWK